MKWLAPFLVVSLTGCGPMTKPMVDRLDKDQQQAVDQVWDNLLTPVDRVNRTVLLDAIVHYNIFQLGVDRLHLAAEKETKAGLVVMQVRFDRTRPEWDEF